MTNYEYAHLGMVYEFTLATNEIVHSEVISHECSSSQIMQTTKSVYKKNRETDFFFWYLFKMRITIC